MGGWVAGVVMATMLAGTVGATGTAPTGTAPAPRRIVMQTHAQRLYEVITGRYADGSPCKVPLTDFLAAFKLVADRVGMPAMTQTEVTGEGGQAMALPLVVVIGEEKTEKRTSEENAP